MGPMLGLVGPVSGFFQWQDELGKFGFLSFALFRIHFFVVSYQFYFIHLLIHLSTCTICDSFLCCFLSVLFYSVTNLFIYMHYL